MKSSFAISQFLQTSIKNKLIKWSEISFAMMLSLLFMRSWNDFENWSKKWKHICLNILIYISSNIWTKCVDFFSIFTKCSWMNLSFVKFWNVINEFTKKWVFSCNNIKFWFIVFYSNRLSRISTKSISTRCMKIENKKMKIWTIDIFERNRRLRTNWR